MSVHFANFHCINIKEIISNGKEGAWNILLTSIRCITHQLSILFIYCYLRRRIIDSYHVFQYFYFFPFKIIPFLKWQFDKGFYSLSDLSTILIKDTLVWHIRYTIVSTNLLTCVYLRCVITVFNVFGYFFAEINFLYINMYIYETFLFIDILDTFLDILLLYKIYTSFTSGYIKHYHTFNNTVSLPLDG